MDINITVRVDSPDIMNSLLALADAMLQVRTGAEIKEEHEIKPKEVQAPKEKSSKRRKT
ncbi:hypothetical protein [Clostridium sp. DMHC 10]|uniref:hypothetical protein n=1 Tax=Clostridium sp. DMHC 10 TaxID=747377 RepID=UPI000B2C2903|nr:hypothetical protein [Clostridium sp. DMHC 10]